MSLLKSLVEFFEMLKEHRNVFEKVFTKDMTQ